MKYYGILIAGLLAATGVAAAQVVEEIGKRGDPLRSPKLQIIDGCVSFTVHDEERKQTTAWKRERPCIGETSNKIEESKQ